MVAGFSAAAMLHAAENVMQRPFAQTAVVPPVGTWVITPWYEYTEFFHYYTGGRKVDIETMAEEDSHGFDQNDGVVEFQWGFKENFAADFTVGYTSAATRSFTAGAPDVRKTSGLSDITFGVRYQLLREAEDPAGWKPSLSFRAGGIYTGSYDKDFPFAPGNGSVGIEPSLAAIKHFGWEGFGAFSSVGYRYMRSGGHDQWFAELGVQQEIKQWTFQVGFRHLANTGGRDIQGTPPTINYSRQIHEVMEQLEGGVSYTDKKHRLYQFYLRKTFDGNNTADALVFGIFASFPLSAQMH